LYAEAVWVCVCLHRISVLKNIVEIFPFPHYCWNKI